MTRMATMSRIQRFLSESWKACAVPVKLVFYVADPKAVANRIRAFGCEITREPTPIETLNGAVVGLAKDPDGYVVELLQSPSAARAEAAA